MPWSTETTYVEGENIVIEHTYTAHHYGHIEIAACPLGSASTWDCFENPNHFLEFVSDELYGEYTAVATRQMLAGTVVSFAY